MKNTNPETEDSIFRKKGFFIALYSCLGAVAILALVITIANLGQPDYQAEDYEQEAAEVGADQVEPYLSQADEEAWFRPRQSPTPAPPPAPPAPTPPPSLPSTPQPRSVPQAEPMPTHEQTPPPTTPAADADEAVIYVDPYYTLATREPYFHPFAEGDSMLWPVYGEIGMGFSMDALIYDPTLDQFRTNDNLRILAQEGTHVQASAAGQVLATGSNAVRGNYVTIDHGNGWIATYGQLADNKLVSTGDIVTAGQHIGTVGQPSIFGTMHGPHVNLRVTRDDVPVNPYELLVARGY